MPKINQIKLHIATFTGDKTFGELMKQLKDDK